MNPLNFKNDLFISYAHLDNQPLSKGEEGWVTLLHERLSLRVGQLLGDKNIRIWRDKKLGGADLFDQAIINELLGSAILISVISPRYVRSDWCLKELVEFCRSAGDNLRIGDK